MEALIAGGLAGVLCKLSPPVGISVLRLAASPLGLTLASLLRCSTRLPNTASSRSVVSLCNGYRAPTRNRPPPSNPADHRSEPELFGPRRYNEPLSGEGEIFR